MTEALPTKASKFIKSYSITKKKTARSILILILDNDRVTVDQISEALGISRRTVLRYLKEFQKSNIIIREGSDTNGRWEFA